MVDTIVLLLSKDMFTVTKSDAFVPSASWIQSPSSLKSRLIQSKQNPSKKELLAGIYKPRLTLSQRMNHLGQYDIALKIEVSLPKLFFGNNFEELQFKDFVPVARKLVTVLESMGISTTVEHLSQAPVSSIHYSKNFHLTDGSTPYHYISKIKDAGVKLSLDINQTDYRNEGHSYKWHCNAYEVVFYDKIKDLEKAKISPKRGIENDSTLQISLLNSLRKQNKLEVLRMEVRLNKRQKMKQLFKTLGIKSDLTFKKLFKPAISRKVLLYYLDELESKRPILFDQRAVHDKALLVSLVINNPELSPKRIMQLFGLKKAFDAMPAGELRTIFAGCNTQSWRRLIADAAEVKLPATPSPFRVLREHLAK